MGGGDVGGGGEGSGVGRLWREGRRDGGASVRRRRTAPRYFYSIIYFHSILYFSASYSILYFYSVLQRLELRISDTPTDSSVAGGSARRRRICAASASAHGAEVAGRPPSCQAPAGPSQWRHCKCGPDPPKPDEANPNEPENLKF